MRRLLLLLLLLPFPLVCQIKILMPVVVKDAQGQPVTDLELSDFHAGGLKNVSIDQMWLVPPQTLSERDTTTPVLVLYDAANAANSNPDLRTKWLRSFLGLVAEHRAPITFYINAAEGLQLIYDPATPPEVLRAALTITEGRNVTSTDPKIEEQAKKLTLLATSRQVRTFRFDYSSNQMNSLIAVARLLPASDTRKPVIWLTTNPDLPYRYMSLPMQEVMVEQFNAAHVSLYPLYIAYNDAWPCWRLHSPPPKSLIGYPSRSRSTVRDRRFAQLRGFWV